MKVEVGLNVFKFKPINVFRFFNFRGLTEPWRIGSGPTHPWGYFVFACNIYAHHIYGPPCLLIQVVHLKQKQLLLHQNATRLSGIDETFPYANA